MEPIESHAAADPSPPSSQAPLSEPAPVIIDAFTAQAPPPVIAAAASESLLEAPAPATAETLLHQPTVEIPAHRTFWGWVMPSLVFVALVMLVLYVTPYLLMHWRVKEAQAEAEATYQKRRAELKAEAE